MHHDRDIPTADASPQRVTRRTRAISLLESSTHTAVAHPGLSECTSCCGSTVQQPDQLLPTPGGNTLATFRGYLNAKHAHQARGSLRSARWHYPQPARPAPHWRRHGGRTALGDPRLAPACCAATPFEQWSDPWALLLRRRSDPAQARRAGTAARCTAQWEQHRHLVREADTAKGRPR